MKLANVVIVLAILASSATVMGQSRSSRPVPFHLADHLGKTMEQMSSLCGSEFVENTSPRDGSFRCESFRHGDKAMVGAPVFIHFDKAGGKVARISAVLPVGSKFEASASTAAFAVNTCAQVDSVKNLEPFLQVMHFTCGGGTFVSIAINENHIILMFSDAPF